MMISSFFKFSRFAPKQQRCAGIIQTRINPRLFGGIGHRAKNFSLNTGPVPLKQLSESFIDGTSAEYVEQQFVSWKKNPESVHASWAAYFRNVEQGLPAGRAYMSPPTLQQKGFFPQVVQTVMQQQQSSTTMDNLNVVNLINAFRVNGHNHANLDPLGLKAKPNSNELDHTTFGFTQTDLNKEFQFSDAATFPFSGQRLGDVISKLKVAYCSTIGAEYMHIEVCDYISLIVLQDPAQRKWLQDKIETQGSLKGTLTPDDKKNLMDRLIWADKFEHYLQMKFGGDKRFGLDGCETLIPGMKTLIDTAADLDVESIVIGMPHRGKFISLLSPYTSISGRLNVLANVIRKPLDHIIKEFDKADTDALKKDFSHSGDVKYHLGTSYDRTTRSGTYRLCTIRFTSTQGKRIHLSLMSNPSHLEAVDPLVEGKTRAKQFYANDTERKTVMSLQLHGDAAFSGQGIVYETMQLSGLENYTTGGVVHIIVNNQIGTQYISLPTLS